MVEKINCKMGSLQKLRKIYQETLRDYELALGAMDFVKSDWCQYLILGIKLTPDDIIKEWDRQLADYTQANYKTRSGKKLTEDVIQQILELHDQGLKQIEIANALGISTEPVRRYVKERRDK